MLQMVNRINLANGLYPILVIAGGLVVILVPLFAWWLRITLWEAFVLDLGLVLFFMVYTFLFALAFDRVFGLPASAQA